MQIRRATTKRGDEELMHLVRIYIGFAGFANVLPTLLVLIQSKQYVLLAANDHNRVALFNSRRISSTF
jgi:hypothetical protein